MSERLHADARSADELHERSRALLVDAVRTAAASGLSQREIAAAIRRSQPEVSRLVHFHGNSELGRRISKSRTKIRDAVAARGFHNVRVFGSVARGTDGPDSDIDLLVDLPAGTSLFSIARLEKELSDLLAVKVDIVSAGALRDHVANRVLREAVPL